QVPVRVLELVLGVAHCATKMLLHGCVGRPADFSGARAGARGKLRGTTPGTTRVRRGATPALRERERRERRLIWASSRPVLSWVSFWVRRGYDAPWRCPLSPPRGVPGSASRCSFGVRRTGLGTTVRRTPS